MKIVNFSNLVILGVLIFNVETTSFADTLRDEKEEISFYTPLGAERKGTKDKIIPSWKEKKGEKITFYV